MICFLPICYWLSKMCKVGGLDSQDQSRSRSRLSLVSRPTFETCQDYPSCQDWKFFSQDFKFFLKINLDLDREFLVWTLMSRLNQKILTVETNFLEVSRFSRLPRLTFWKCQYRDSRSRHDRDKSRPPSLTSCPSIFWHETRFGIRDISPRSFA